MLRKWICMETGQRQAHFLIIIYSFVLESNNALNQFVPPPSWSARSWETFAITAWRRATSLSSYAIGLLNEKLKEIKSSSYKNLQKNKQLFHTPSSSLNQINQSFEVGAVMPAANPFHSRSVFSASWSLGLTYWWTVWSVSSAVVPYGYICAVASCGS